MFRFVKAGLRRLGAWLARTSLAVEAEPHELVTDRPSAFSPPTPPAPTARESQKPALPPEWQDVDKRVDATGKVVLVPGGRYEGSGPFDSACRGSTPAFQAAILSPDELNDYINKNPIFFRKTLDAPTDLSAVEKAVYDRLRAVIARF